MDEVPVGGTSRNEDGFRCLLFRDGDHIELQSKAERSVYRDIPRSLLPRKLKPSASCWTAN